MAGLVAECATNNADSEVFVGSALVANREGCFGGATDSDSGWEENNIVAQEENRSKIQVLAWVERRNGRRTRRAARVGAIYYYVGLMSLKSLKSLESPNHLVGLEDKVVMQVGWGRRLSKRKIGPATWVRSPRWNRPQTWYSGCMYSGCNP